MSRDSCSSGRHAGPLLPAVPEAQTYPNGVLTLAAAAAREVVRKVALRGRPGTEGSRARAATYRDAG